MSKKKPTPKKKADQARSHFTARKHYRKAERPRDVLTAFLILIEGARTSTEVTLGRASAAGAAMGLCRAGLVGDEFVIDSLTAIDHVAFRKYAELAGQQKETLQ